MLSAFLAVLFYLSPIFWMALLLALTTAGSLEWTRLSRFSLNHTIAYLLLTVLLAGELLFVLSSAVAVDPYTPSFLGVYVASLIFWIFGATIFLKSKRPVGSAVLLAFIGWLVLLPTCLALYQLRAIDPLLLLGFMGANWLSDTAAYFSGRTWGKNKLAPSISPGKTWEGVAGALVAVLVYAFIWSYGEDAIPATLLIPLLLLLAALGIVGDLFESLMKRHAGLKDSGAI
jgi:phosphatidate cytidylyltransferase